MPTEASIITIRVLSTVLFTVTVLFFLKRSREKSLDRHNMGTAKFPLPSNNWNTTASHLKAARALLPTSLVEYPQNEGGNLAAFEEYLNHNEWGLALAELEGLGESNPCPPAFWHELAEAAGNMWLSEQATSYREKASLSKFDIS